MELERSSGVLLHPTSLPGGHGIGDLGAVAREFVDRLEFAAQRWWQILPLNPTDHLGSPYSATSSMASNPSLIDLTDLADRGWLDEVELASMPKPADPSNVDFSVVGAAKDKALRAAFDRAPGGIDEFDAYVAGQAHWLDDYALFAALRHKYGGDWRRWPDELVRRSPGSLEQVRAGLAEEVRYQKFVQWIFDQQWSALRSYAAERDVRIIGDVPIFVAMDSADVWANREIFKVDENGNASVVAGVPPDYFSPTGQKWGNPVFRWDVLEETNYEWWGRRIRRVRELCDIVRIDHFRGFESYWEVPADAPTAETGEWVDGPGAKFFEWVRDEFSEVPFIAEDLGMITREVEELRDEQGLPGMKVLQFAFDGNPDHPFLPHTYPEHCVAYTGTHDNDTALGWWRSTSDEVRHRVRTYLSHPDEGIVWALIDALIASDANLTVVPVQDIYELGNEARMNTPGTSEGNWGWRMKRELFDNEQPWQRLGELTELYGR